MTWKVGDRARTSDPFLALNNQVVILRWRSSTRCTWYCGFNGMEYPIDERHLHPYIPIPTLAERQAALAEKIRKLREIRSQELQAIERDVKVMIEEAVASGIMERDEAGSWYLLLTGQYGSTANSGSIYEKIIRGNFALAENRLKILEAKQEPLPNLIPKLRVFPNPTVLAGRPMMTDYTQSRHGKTLFNRHEHAPDMVGIDNGPYEVLIPIADLRAFVEAQPRTGESMNNDRDFVRSKYPDAMARLASYDVWFILPGTDQWGNVLGHGLTEDAAWHNAAVALGGGQ